MRGTFVVESSHRINVTEIAFAPVGGTGLRRRHRASCTGKTDRRSPIGGIQPSCWFRHDHRLCLFGRRALPVCPDQRLYRDDALRTAVSQEAISVVQGCESEADPSACARERVQAIDPAIRLPVGWPDEDGIDAIQGELSP